MCIISLIKTINETFSGKTAQEREPDRPVYANKQESVLHEIDMMGLRIKNLTVDFDPVTAIATVSGTVPDRATRENVILRIGCAEGVVAVDDKLTYEDAPGDAQKLENNN